MPTFRYNVEERAAGKEDGRGMIRQIGKEPGQKILEVTEQSQMHQVIKESQG